ncbi:S9 family peptidase [Nakamurella endophytica]|uniref:Peptide hydrolase n=1 Tax=Nakamurella endophytica TaxID=1748367 RepID=A0A917WHL1_9ACTN|nr:prolyl oligopeptidase family serine peptidase [Nakamurella endophytica]GGM05553.1 peptide hydrolase [Nakamurella endophytica]
MTSAASPAGAPEPDARAGAPDTRPGGAPSVAPSEAPSVDGVATAAPALAPAPDGTPADGPATRHPRARVPERLFDDPDREDRWRRRFSAVRISLPDPARDAPDRTVVLSNATGTYELYCWDAATGRQTQATQRPDGTVHGQLSADGEALFWFHDEAGDEFGSWQWQPFGGGPGSASPAMPDVAPGYPAGLAVGRSVVLAGFSDDDGSRVHRVATHGTATEVYRSDCDAGVGALSTDETLWVLSHSEHGDSRYPALRALRVDDGSVVGELDDSPGRGLEAVVFSPVPGDQRLLVGHERGGRDELLLWDLATGDVRELAIDLPGDLAGDFYPDAQALLVAHTRAGRTTLHRYDLATEELTDLPAARGVVSGAIARPDGSVWYRWSNAAEPARLRRLDAAGADTVLLPTPGRPAPWSEPVHDVWVDGPGGRIHALLARPAELGAPAGPGRTQQAGPAVFYLHGGPADADEDVYDATRAAWLDAGFVVVQVNYRGSTGYGSAWRDALTERVGHTELADIAAVHDALVVAGMVDVGRSVLAGASWGGFLTLLGVGAQPGRWAAAIAGVPVADYVQAYEDEMEQLRAYDRALFGGAPDDRPAAYTDSSPLTWVDQVRTPLLVLAGENDPRCPIRQVDTYLDALADRGARYEVYRFDAGHGSMVVEERLRQVACDIDFARRVLAG